MGKSKKIITKARLLGKDYKTILTYWDMIAS
jgi:hypothetical protein